MIEREQRLVFGEVADEYQRFRPGYPTALFDAIAELTGVVAGDAVLDAGAGTGKATENLVARDYRVTAVEPSAEMARVLRARFPDMAVQVCGFEECEVPEHAFALITAGQSWHWVDPERGPRKAHAVLRPGGWLALFWNVAALDGCGWHDDLQAIYLSIAPQLAHANLRPARDAGAQARFTHVRDSGLFHPAVGRRMPWDMQYTTAEYVSLLETHSNHRLLPDQQRAALHAAIADELDARGGVVDHPYTTELLALQVK